MQSGLSPIKKPTIVSPLSKRVAKHARNTSMPIQLSQMATKSPAKSPPSNRSPSPYKGITLNSTHTVDSATKLLEMPDTMREKEKEIEQWSLEDALNHYYQLLELKKSQHGIYSPVPRQIFDRVSVFMKGNRQKLKKLIDFYWDKMDSCVNQHKKWLDMYANKAKAEQNQAHYKENVKYLNIIEFVEDILGMDDKKYNERFIAYSKLYYDFGKVYIYQEEFNSAIKYIQRSLDIASAAQEFKDIPNYKYQHTIGEIHRMKQEYAQSTQCYEIALKIAQKEYSEKSEQVATCMSELGVALQCQHRYDESMHKFKQSLRLYQAVFGFYNEDVAVTYDWIAFIHDKKGNYSAAIQNLNRALEIYFTKSGQYHPGVVECYRKISFLNEKKGNMKQAFVVRNKALELLLLSDKQDKYLIAETYREIGILLEEIKESQKALEAYKKSLDQFIQLNGENHITTANVYKLIGLNLANNGKVEEGVAFLEKSQELYFRVVPDDPAIGEIDEALVRFDSSQRGRVNNRYIPPNKLRRDPFIYKQLKTEA